MSSSALLKSPLYDLEGNPYELTESLITVAQEGGGLLLINLDAHTFRINPVGHLLLMALAFPLPQETLSRLSRHWSISEERVFQDASQMLIELHTKGLIQRKGTEKKRTLTFLAVASKTLILIVFKLFANLPFSISCLLSLLLFRGLLLHKSFYFLSQEIMATFLTSDNPEKTLNTKTLEKIHQGILRAKKHLWLPISCKETALSSWLLCLKNGYPAKLHLGISLYPLVAHT